MATPKDLLKVMRVHQQQDALIQGEWWRDNEKRGCFYGCAMQTEDDAIKKACEKYQLPQWLGYWSEKVFEGLPDGEYQQWPVQLLEAFVQFNGDTEQLRHDLAIKRLSYLSERREGAVKDAIDGVIACHKNPKNADWDSAARAAWSAADSAWSAAESAADSAAWQRERDWMLELLQEGAK